MLFCVLIVALLLRRCAGKRVAILRVSFFIPLLCGRLPSQFEQVQLLDRLVGYLIAANDVLASEDPHKLVDTYGRVEPHHRFSRFWIEDDAGMQKIPAFFLREIVRQIGWRMLLRGRRGPLARLGCIVDPGF